MRGQSEARVSCDLRLGGGVAIRYSHGKSFNCDHDDGEIMSAPRAIGSGVLSAGLVSVPFKIYSAASAESTSFNLLHGECKCRCKQQFVCTTCSSERSSAPRVVERSDMVKGFEYAKDQYVVFTEEELKSLQADKTDALEIVEFVHEGDVDLLAIEKSYYLGPDKGGEKAYQLLAQAMGDMGVIGVGRHWARGKVQLVLIRPYRGGLVLHYAFYQTEIRSFGEIAPASQVSFKEAEIDLARRYVDSMTSASFQPGKYHDEYEDRVRAAVEAKIAGQELRVSAEPPKGTILDIFEALKRSISPEALKKPSPKPRRGKTK